MAVSIPASVEPSVLRWARESIDLTPVAAARRIGVPDDRVEQWESGEVRPTIAQLRKAAEVYKRTLAVFFLPRPPDDFDTLRDFRRLKGAGVGAWSPELHDEYRRAHRQREAALELAELEDYAPASAWKIQPLPASDDDIASAARNRLLGEAPLRLPHGRATVYDHLNVWVSGLEAAGVLVFATSGGRVQVSEMRAFSLYFEDLPVIVVNGADAARGRLFSLLHEYAHLLLHTEGLCDMVVDSRATSPELRLEARCNALAASILMPADLVLASPPVQARASSPSSWDYTALAEAAAPFGVSAEAFLRRLVSLSRVDADFYSRRRDEFLAVYEAEEARTRPPGGDWYRNTARDLGKGFVRLVADARRRRVIDSYTAASYLNVKVGQIDRLAQAASIRVPTG